ncbi:unnamed protein product [Candidula unifasciata]|uniref:Uncharacterized protein n=1 Tax=Candidula unifasciata TaxID=100452 RepID=A0A8S3YY47_9EUPU|nr:unnamed protein product [Candidula unifasciata]
MTSRLMMIGQVICREALKPRILTVRIIDQVYDAHLHMFFPEPKDFKVLETEKAKVKAGDIIRFQKSPERYSVEVEYETAEVVFPIGRTVDPVTGRRCRGTQFIDERAREQETKRISSIKDWPNYSL